MSIILCRRKIVTYLMILGNAGIVTVIATFVVSLGPSGFLRPSLALLALRYVYPVKWEPYFTGALRRPPSVI